MVVFRNRTGVTVRLGGFETSDLYGSLFNERVLTPGEWVDILSIGGTGSDFHISDESFQEICMIRFAGRSWRYWPDEKYDLVSVDGELQLIERPDPITHGP